ncbi:hypothetical protein DERF_011213 [Dermatophagoides farinae]|uniref:Uncharacterized protein n=1 Tax=Dermatophagoides farinae TaxID=6954 RepID=A0A922L047_DERFA|nr:hypothetical protein DERF_011213 [Dermatophagoides farinae]
MIAGLENSEATASPFDEGRKWPPCDRTFLSIDRNSMALKGKDDRRSLCISPPSPLSLVGSMSL